jgi:hypothetical protein
LLLAAGVAASLGVFGLSFDNLFRNDDYVLLDHTISSRSLYQLLSPPPEDFAFYRPGAILLFSLEYVLFGLHSGSFLAFNYLLHLSNGILLLWILREAGLGGGVAALAASLFMVGFCHWAKEVIWACTSGTLVSVGLMSIAMALAIRLARSRDSSSAPRSSARWRLQAGILFCVAVAPLFHEASLIAPGLIFGIGWLYDSRRLRDRLSSFLPCCVPGIAWAATLVVISSRYPGYREPEPRLLHAPLTLVRYLGFILLPLQESQVALAPRLQGLFSASAVVASAVAFWRGSKLTKLLFSWVYLGLVPFALVNLPGGWLEPRYLYFASLPCCALAAILFGRLYDNRRALIRVAAVAAVVGVAFCTLLFERHVEGACDRISHQPANLERLRLLQSQLAATHDP